MRARQGRCETAPATLLGQNYTGVLSFSGEGSLEDELGILNQDRFVRLAAGANDLKDSAQKDGRLASAAWSNGSQQASLKCERIEHLAANFPATKASELEALPQVGASADVKITNSMLMPFLQYLLAARKPLALAHAAMGAYCYQPFTDWKAQIAGHKLSASKKVEARAVLKEKLLRMFNNQELQLWISRMEQAGSSSPRTDLSSAFNAICVNPFMQAIDAVPTDDN